MERQASWYETLPRGGADDWDDGFYGGLITAEFFGAALVVPQTVTQTNGFESASAFGAGSVSAGGIPSQTITQTVGFVDVDAFGAGATRLRLGGTGFVDADAFGAGSASIRIAGTSFLDADSFGAGSLSARLAGTGFVDPNAFGAGAITVGQPPQTITQTAGFADADAFGAGTARLRLVQTEGHVGAQEFGAGRVTVTGGLVRGPRRGSAPRPQQSEARPANAETLRQPREASARTTTNTNRPGDAVATRTAA